MHMHTASYIYTYLYICIHLYICIYMYNKNHKNSLLIQIQFRPNCIPLDWIAESYPLQLRTQTLYFPYLQSIKKILVILFCNVQRKLK